MKYIIPSNILFKEYLVCPFCGLEPFPKYVLIAPDYSAFAQISDIVRAFIVIGTKTRENRDFKRHFPSGYLQKRVP